MQIARWYFTTLPVFFSLLFFVLLVWFEERLSADGDSCVEVGDTGRFGETDAATPKHERGADAATPVPGEEKLRHELGQGDSCSNVLRDALEREDKNLPFEANNLLAGGEDNLRCRNLLAGGEDNLSGPTRLSADGEPTLEEERSEEARLEELRHEFGQGDSCSNVLRDALEREGVTLIEVEAKLYWMGRPKGNRLDRIEDQIFSQKSRTDDEYNFNLIAADEKSYKFETDLEICYQSCASANNFGPLNLAVIWRYCWLLEKVFEVS